MTALVAALLARMREAPDHEAAVNAFESTLFALPPFCNGDVMIEAASHYAALGRHQASRLLHGLAQMIGGGTPGPTSEEAAAVLLAPHPGPALQHRLELLDRPPLPERAASLLREVFAHAGPITDYWVYYRASRVFAELGSADEAFLFSSLTLQIEPAAEVSFVPARDVSLRLCELGAWRDAARLLRRWHAAQPGRHLLEPEREADVLTRAGPDIDLKLEGRRDRTLVDGSARPALPLGVYGRSVPYALKELLVAGWRPSITMAQLEDAQLLIAQHQVAVFGRDGTPHGDLCVGEQPFTLIEATLASRRVQGEVLDALTLDDGVLISDTFPAPNLCHFMLDQSTRLALYARAGIDLATATVIGPDLAQTYQYDIARRMGARRYVGTSGFGTVQVRRLAVLSNCRYLHHPAHLGSDWALAAVRAAFGVDGQGPRTKKLFLSREDAASRQLVNEAEVAAMLHPHGFERIVPGQMSVCEQAAAFAQATHVVGLHGAALANLAFCAPGTQVLEIFHPLYGTYAYAALAPALGLHYAAMVGRDGHSDAERDNDPALAHERKNECMGSDVRADLPELKRWLAEAT